MFLLVSACAPPNLSRTDTTLRSVAASASKSGCKVTSGGMLSSMLSSCASSARPFSSLAAAAMPRPSSFLARGARARSKWPSKLRTAANAASATPWTVPSCPASFQEVAPSPATSVERPATCFVASAAATAASTRSKSMQSTESCTLRISPCCLVSLIDIEVKTGVKSTSGLACSLARAVACRSPAFAMPSSAKEIGGKPSLVARTSTFMDAWTSSRLANRLCNCRPCSWSTCKLGCKSCGPLSVPRRPCPVAEVRPEIMSTLPSRSVLPCARARRQGEAHAPARGRTPRSGTPPPPAPRPTSPPGAVPRRAAPPRAPRGPAWRAPRVRPRSSGKRPARDISSCAAGLERLPIRLQRPHAIRDASQLGTKCLGELLDTRHGPHQGVEVHRGLHLEGLH
mmetsp:Transcript_5587/g.21077  ORF Transcript_5587/g.21077 Transcript_5587/m.21077 type:complete len:398 (-) Transcript_5587:153-1346(-)